MTDQQKPDRPQTLLEAAKALMDLSLPLGEYRWANLRAAIAREEAKPATDAQVDYQAGRAAWWQIKASEANDRAQQAESTAAWHKAESERLSAELAKAKESAAHLEKLRVEANELARYWALNYREAGAKLAERRKEGLPAFEGDPKACAFPEPRDPLTGWTFDTYRKMVQCLSREVPK